METKWEKGFHDPYYEGAHFSGKEAGRLSCPGSVAGAPPGVAGPMLASAARLLPAVARPLGRPGLVGLGCSVSGRRYSTQPTRWHPLGVAARLRAVAGLVRPDWNEWAILSPVFFL